MQGKGFSKGVFKSFYKQYQNAGIDKIEVHANIDVGGYTWARYGFMATKPKDVLTIIKKAEQMANNNLIPKDDYYKIQKEFADYSWDVKNNKTKTYEFPMWKISEGDSGKKVLLGSDWEGTINLKDANQRTRFENYLFKAK